MPEEQRPWIGRFTADELSNDAYHEAPGISKSHLDCIAFGSGKHYWQRYVNPDRPPFHRTPALRVGNAVHTAILQPDLFESLYAAKPECDRRTVAGKAIYAAFLERKGSREELSPSEYDWCLGMRDAVHRHRIARGLLCKGTAEHSFFAKEPETGELVKCRTDYLHDDAEMVVDIKTTMDAHPDSFGKSATDFLYDLAVPWYYDVLLQVIGQTPRNWVWIAIEKEEPYAMGIYYAQKQDINRARDTCRRLFREILEQRRLATWEDYGAKVLPLILKPWAKR